MPSPTPLRVLVTCAGLDHVNRGFETFTRECFHSLENDDRLAVNLVKGSGSQRQGELVAWSVPRTNPLMASLSARLGKQAWFMEHITFTMGLAVQIRRHRPDVVLLSERAVARSLDLFRRRMLPPFRLLLSNSGPSRPPFPFVDHIQQPTSPLYDAAIEAGETPDRQTLLPLGCHIPERLTILSPADKRDLRRQLNLPEDRPLVLSVAAINRSHKRIDYLIAEMAGLGKQRPYVVMLGQREEESPPLEEQAKRELGPDGFTMRSVPKDKVGDYYDAADMFVHTAAKEGFGLVYVEALSHGLPCIAHDFPISRFVLGEHGRMENLEKPGVLATALVEEMNRGDDERRRRARHAYAHERFSWHVLAPQYAEMLLRSHGNA